MSRCKYSIAAERRGDNWVFRVEDNGIGIDKQYAEVVFQMFKRLHNAAAMKAAALASPWSKKSSSGTAAAYGSTPHWRKVRHSISRMPATQGHLA